MTRYLPLCFAILAIAASLSSTPASAQPRCDASHAFVLMLGVGY
jgi:hypothetical protein